MLEASRAVQARRARRHKESTDIEPGLVTWNAFHNQLKSFVLFRRAAGRGLQGSKPMSRRAFIKKKTPPPGALSHVMGGII